MCDEYNIEIGIKPRFKKLLFGNEEIPFDRTFIKPCNNNKCPKYREIQTIKQTPIGYCIKQS